MKPKPTKLTDERATHRALRASVDARGQDAPRDLYALFDYFNRRFFASALADPAILLAPTSSPRAVGDYTPRDVHGLASVVRIHPAVFKLGWPQAAGTLLHEMVHACQHETLGDTEPGYQGHGPMFAAMANTIGAELGFPPVSPRGRKAGTFPAETWPHLPLEGGGFGPIRPRKPKATPAPAPAEDLDDDEAEGAKGDTLAAMRAAIARGVASYIRSEADRVRSQKPKLAASWCNLAARIDAGEHERSRGHE